MDGTRRNAGNSKGIPWAIRKQRIKSLSVNSIPENTGGSNWNPQGIPIFDCVCYIDFMLKNGCEKNIFNCSRVSIGVSSILGIFEGKGRLGEERESVIQP